MRLNPATRRVSVFEYLGLRVCQPAYVKTVKVPDFTVVPSMSFNTVRFPYPPRLPDDFAAKGLQGREGAKRDLKLKPHVSTDSLCKIVQVYIILFRPCIVEKISTAALPAIC